MSGRPAKRQATVREAVFDLFRAFGMTTIFGNPGSTELPMYRDFPDDFHYVLGLQEIVAVGMADGYAQATRNAGLVNLHSAAGVGHAFENRPAEVATVGATGQADERAAGAEVPTGRALAEHRAERDFLHVAEHRRPDVELASK